MGADPVDPADVSVEDLQEIAGRQTDSSVLGPGPVVSLDDDDSGTWRPSLVKLTSDLRDMREELMDGFETISEILWWMQRLTVRTLGQLPQSLFHRFGRQVRVNFSRPEGSPLVRALLIPAHRPEREDCPLNHARTTEFRESFAAETITPAFEEAFRDLRSESTEYVDDSEGSDDADHDPLSQRHVAMRPALDELERWQRKALGPVIGESSDLQERGDILEWLEGVALATHGEPIQVLEGSDLARLEDFGSRCYQERTTARLLLSGPENQAARELFAARFLLPAFNRGVAVLAGRAGELPDAEREERTPMMG